MRGLPHGTCLCVLVCFFFLESSLPCWFFSQHPINSKSIQEHHRSSLRWDSPLPLNTSLARLEATKGKDEASGSSGLVSLVFRWFLVVFCSGVFFLVGFWLFWLVIFVVFMGQKDANPWGPQVAVGSIFPFTNLGFLGTRYF